MDEMDVWVYGPDGALMRITEENATDAIAKHGDYADQYVFFFADLSTAA